MIIDLETYERMPGNMKDCFMENDAFTSLSEQSRFFFNVNRQIDEADPVMYQAKASRKERDAGLDGMAELRDDITEKEREYVIEELRKHGLL